MAPRLSAIAARKAAQHVKQPVESATAQCESVLSEHVISEDDIIQDVVRPKKRKRSQRIVPDSSTEHASTKTTSQATSSIVTASEAPLNLSLETEDSADTSDFDSDTSNFNASSENPASIPEKGLGNRSFLLSSFHPSVDSVIEDNKTTLTVRIGPKDTLTLIGQYDLWVRQGAVSIYGAVIHASSRLNRVYAPSMHALPVLRSLPNPYGFDDQLAEISIISCGSRIRLLQNVSSRFRKIWSRHSAVGHASERPCDQSRRSFSLLRDDVAIIPSTSRPILCSLQPPPAWLRTIAGFVGRQKEGEPVAVLVSGPKASGKSTFCRMLANGMLTSSPCVQNTVVFMDLDPGQPEYGPPGQVSLIELASPNLGCPFTHPDSSSQTGGEVVRRHYLGALSPKDDVQHFLACAANLFETYGRLLSTSQNASLIVNYPGWVQGGGLDVLIRLIKRSRLTDVVYTSNTGSEDNIEALEKVCSGGSIALHVTESQPSLHVPRTASDLRIMQTLSYFHLAESEGGNHRWNSTPLNKRPPMAVKYMGVDQAILGVMVLGDTHCFKFLGSVLEGAIVDIVEVEDDLVFDAASSTRSHGLSLSSEQEHRLSAQVNGDADGTANHNDAANAENAPQYLQHAAIARNDTGIPYIRPVNNVTRPLSPGYSHSLGQALIRFIDTRNHTFHLITPVPAERLQALHEQKRKIVLVHGNLDTPTWAYKEGLEFEKSRRRRLEKHGVTIESDTVDRIRQWAQTTPWAHIADGERKGSARKRSGRKDLKYKSQAQEKSSS